MKKRKTKNYLKTGILLLGISLLLWNCEKETTIEQSLEINELIQQFNEPLVENLTLKQALDEYKFNSLNEYFKLNKIKDKLKNSYNKNQFTTDTLGITIITNSIKKITFNNYVSYTMLMYEPNDTSGNISNLIIQEKNGIESVFTIRYASYSNKNATSQKESADDFSLKTGIIPHDGWNETGEGSEGGGSSNGDFVEVCYTVVIQEPYACGCGHMPGQGCNGCEWYSPRYPGYHSIPKETCEWVYVSGNDNTSDSSNTSSGSTGTPSGGGNTSTTNPDVITTPVKDLIPEGMSIENYLNIQIEVDPFKLIEIDCEQIQHWQSLAQHTPPQSVVEKIQDLKDNHEALLGDWNIQYLNNAGGAVINLDYFGVNITTLPNNPNTGQQFTPQQFLDYFRRNINNFVTGTSFSSFCEIQDICQQETNLWNSNNPLGSIVKLDISLYNGPGGNILANDGVVVCAEYTNDYWRFMTMEAPYDSSHPVTGTRQFGIEQNSNGSYNIYVRGVDRFSSRIQEIGLDIFLSDPFLFADNLWESFQVKTNNFINQNGGNSSVIIPVHNRPDWNKVKDVLLGDRPISDLGCN